MNCLMVREMVKKILVYIIMILAAAGPAAGQRFSGVVTGRITDEAGAPMAGASVVIESLRAGVAADNDGRYALRGLRDGTYSLRISFTGGTVPGRGGHCQGESRRQPHTHGAQHSACFRAEGA